MMPRKENKNRAIVYLKEMDFNWNQLAEALQDDRRNIKKVYKRDRERYLPDFIQQVKTIQTKGLAKDFIKKMKEKVE